MSGEAEQQPDAQARAEQLVDRVTRDIGRFARLAIARAREEAEDIWAEARSVAGHGQAEASPSPDGDDASSSRTGPDAAASPGGHT